MKNILLNLAAALALLSPASAADFSLDSLSLSGMRAAAEGIKAPVPGPHPALSDAEGEDTAESGDTIGVDALIRVPFPAIKKAIGRIAALEKRLAIVDPSAPVVTRAGEFLKVSNIRMDVNGIITEPTLTLKPYLEGRDRLAVRIQRVQLHASMTPDKSRAAARQFSQEDMMEQVMAVAAKGIMNALDARFAAKHLPIRAADVLALKYDKAAWTLHAAVSPNYVQVYLPRGLFGDIHLTGFSFDDSGIAVKFGTAD